MCVIFLIPFFNRGLMMANGFDVYILASLAACL